MNIRTYRYESPAEDRIDLLDDLGGDVGVFMWQRVYVGNATRAEIAETLFADWRKAEDA